MSTVALADAAEQLVGAPFRLHGRDPRTGLDCIGVLAASLEAIGKTASFPDRYAMRCRSVTGLDRIASDAGFAPTADPVAPGDVLFARVGACQFHLLLAGHGGYLIHAHAGLRRVIRTAGPVAWPVVARWRLQDTPV